MSDFDTFGRNMQNMANDFIGGARDVANNVSGSISGMSEGMRRMKDFSQTGRDLFVTGAVTSHGGNLSECDGSRLWITRHGSMLGRLESGDIIETSANTVGEHDIDCSVELVVHRAMYAAWAKRSGRVVEAGPNDISSVAAKAGYKAAIVHAHTRNTILRSMLFDEVVPADSEGIYVLGGGVKVLCPQKTIGSEESASLLFDAILSGCDVAIVKGHGPFAIAETMEKAFQLVSCLEASASILNMRDMMKGR